MLNKLGFVRIGCVSPKMEVADVESNCREIANAIKEAENKKVQILVFPELCITGYTCADLFMQDALIEASLKGLEYILENTKSLKVTSIVGMPLRNQNQLFNVAVVINKGKILGIIPKTNIPNHGEFYEKRWFSSSRESHSQEIEILDCKVPFGIDLIFEDTENKNISFAVEICEDLWVPIPPSVNYALNGANIICNLSASNETIGKYEYRKNLIENISAKLFSAYAYASSGIGESSTDLVFGGQTLIAENGTILQEGKRFEFETNMIYTDIDVQTLANERYKNKSYMNSPKSIECRKVFFNLDKVEEEIVREYNKYPFVPQSKEKVDEICEEIFNIQSSALAKRLKSINSSKVVIGISGGLDSTLAFLTINKTFEKLNLDKKGIIAITMPGFGTSNSTYENSINLVKEYGATLKIIDIREACKKHFEDINHSEEIKDVTYENVQARERTQILMDIANKENAIVIGTGDMSELALGWCTYNGDQMSMYGINNSIPKTLVKHLINWVKENEEGEIKDILGDILNTPISPELLPADKEGNIKQKTEEIVGPYKLHDFYLYYFLRKSMSPEKILYIAEKAFKDEYSKETIKENLEIFIKRFFTSQFKRSCMPDGVKVGSVSLSPRGDLRMPSDAKYYEWTKKISIE